MGVAMSCAVVDSGDQLVAFERMDAADLVTVTLARDRRSPRSRTGCRRATWRRWSSPARSSTATTWSRAAGRSCSRAGCRWSSTACWSARSASAAAHLKRTAGRRCGRARVHGEVGGRPACAGVFGVSWRRPPARAPAGRRRGEELRLVGALPRRVQVLATEVAVRGGLAVDRLPQLQRVDDRRGPQVEVPLDQAEDPVVRQLAGAEQVDTEIGRAMPMPYATSISNRSARPAATTFFATQRAA